MSSQANEASSSTSANDVPPWLSQFMTQMSDTFTNMSRIPVSTAPDRVPLSTITKTLSSVEIADIIQQVSSALGCAKSKTSKSTNNQTTAQPATSRVQTTLAKTSTVKKGRKPFPRDANNKIIRPKKPTKN